MLEQKDVNFGFDAQKAEYVNMIKAGVIDPTKVVRAALQGAVSVAGLLITTEAMVAEAPVIFVTQHSTVTGSCRCTSGRR